MRRIVLLVAVLAAALTFTAGASARSTLSPRSSHAPQIRHGSAGKFGTAAAPTVGEVLTATNGTWTGSSLTFTYQWQDCNSSGASCSNISGATSSSYTIVSGDLGDTIRITVTATNSGGSASQNSAVTGVVTTNLPVNLTAPTLAGTTSPGSTITLTPGTFSNETTQDGVWEQCPTAVSTTCTPTANTGNTYVTGSSDAGLYIRLMETATNANGDTVIWSNAIGPISSGGGGGGGGGGGFTGTCTKTISPSSTSGAIAAALTGMTAGQVLCLNTGAYGCTTTCINRYTASGTSGNPIIITSGPGQTATIRGGNEFHDDYVTMENLNIDESNTESSGIGGANPTPHCAQMAKAEAIEFETGTGYAATGDTLQDNNIYQSVPSTREILIFIDAGNNITVRNNTISNAGSCDQTQHLIYDDAGSGNLIYDNWFWSDQFGYAVQLYPNPGTTQVYSNVMDGVLDGLVVDSGVGGNLVQHNVVINPVTTNSDGYGGGAFMTCFHDQTGATDTIANNAVFNASGGFGGSGGGNCTNAHITVSGSTTLTSNPFVSSSTRDYTLCTTGNGACTSGQITQANLLSAYDLWNGSGPPSPNPAAAFSVTRTATAGVTPQQAQHLPPGCGVSCPKPVLIHEGPAPSRPTDLLRRRAAAHESSSSMSSWWWIGPGIAVLLMLAGGAIYTVRRRG